MDATQAATAINAMHEGNWASALGVVLVSASRDEVVARVEVRPEHRQPMGLVHGGVYSGVVETLASVGAGLDAMAKGKTIVGLENHTSFVRAVREGTLTARATPLTRGSRSQLWEATIRNDDGAIVATGRVRLLLLDAGTEVAGRELALEGG
jgi:uncharacterized protein (TIGR00369 family)